MTTGRINQITIFKHCCSAGVSEEPPLERQGKVVVGLANNCMILAATTGSVSARAAEGLVLS
jgi:hypothetical protein